MNLMTVLAPRNKLSGHELQFCEYNDGMAKLNQPLKYNGHG
jgi:hypothetical protein